MRDLIGTRWHFRYGSKDEEFVVVDRNRTTGVFVVLETATSTFHPAELPGWDDVLHVRLFYRGAYFASNTLVPLEPLKTQITALG